MARRQHFQTGKQCDAGMDLSMKTQHLFVYGTLMADSVMRRVCGRAPTSCEGRLDDFIRLQVAGEAYPGIIRQAGACVRGLVYLNVSQSQFRTLDAYEGEEYLRQAVKVFAGEKALDVYTYVFAPAFRHRLTSKPWCLEEFLKRDLASYLSRDF